MKISKTYIYRFFGCALSLFSYLSADQAALRPKPNSLPNNKIDVVVISTASDINTLDLCLNGVKENAANVGRVIVVSENKLTDKAEWFDTRNYPFTKEEVNAELSKDVANSEYEELLRLYAAVVIPELSSTFLVLQPDTIILNPINFEQESFKSFFNLSTLLKSDGKQSIYQLLPDLKKSAYLSANGIFNHMIFKKAIVEDLINSVQGNQRREFWRAYCGTFLPTVEASHSAYEIYCNFMFAKHPASMFPANETEYKSISVFDISAMQPLKDHGYHYISCRRESKKWLLEGVNAKASLVPSNRSAQAYNQLADPLKLNPVYDAIMVVKPVEAAE